jgi:hypothetical protein
MDRQLNTQRESQCGVLFFCQNLNPLEVLIGMKKEIMQAFPLEGKANRKVNI